MLWSLSGDLDKLTCMKLNSSSLYVLLIIAEIYIYKIVVDSSN